MAIKDEQTHNNDTRTQWKNEGSEKITDHIFKVHNDFLLLFLDNPVENFREIREVVK